MGIYIVLIIYILFLPLLVDPFCKTAEKKRNAIVFLGMTAIFLILALKGDVGSDISGYMEQYYISGKKSWFDIDYVYFEPGYITLTKIFAKAGASFQTFMIFVYALACSSMFFFVKKYSKNPTVSLIIFICYQFFVFYISGVRQTIAMSLCLISYMVFQKRKLWAYILSFLIVFLAMSIHTSAIVFLVVLVFSFVKSKKINPAFYVVAIVSSVVIRPIVWKLVDMFFRHVDVATEMRLAGNFVFLCGIALFMYFVNVDNNVFNINLKYNKVSDDEEKDNVFFTKMILVTICANLIFSGHSLLRAAMYPMMFIIPGLPNSTSRLEPKFRWLLDYLFVVFFVALFYFETLEPNQLELCPYVFFWE